MTVLRHLLAILLLPTVVVVLVPRWLIGSRLPVPAQLDVPRAVAIASQVAGGIAMLVGAALFAWCVALFARVGKGTLAPWDPTRRLVAVGPYRHVRNPMISGVAFVLLGESLVLRSPRLGLWLLLFLAINQAWFLFVEEPGLERRFGDEYLRYRTAVPRWIPTLRATRS
jgi:protein-S-isoprenylcysteine O-methyltransferase Ste14